MSARTAQSLAHRQNGTRSLLQRQSQRTSGLKADDDLRVFVLAPLLFRPWICEDHQTFRGLPRRNDLVARQRWHAHDCQFWKALHEPVNVLRQRRRTLIRFARQFHIRHRSKIVSGSLLIFVTRACTSSTVSSCSGKRQATPAPSARLASIHLHWVHHFPQHGAGCIRLRSPEMGEQCPRNRESNDYDNRGNDKGTPRFCGSISSISSAPTLREGESGRFGESGVFMVASSLLGIGEIRRQSFREFGNEIPVAIPRLTAYSTHHPRSIRHDAVDGCHSAFSPDATCDVRPCSRQFCSPTPLPVADCDRSDPGDPDMHCARLPRPAQRAPQHRIQVELVRLATQ